jgi:hypothetical protein
LGRLPVHFGAPEITAQSGVVTLGGRILADELPKVLRAVRYVRGVKEIDNQLDVQTPTDNVSAFQGEPQPFGAV